MKFTDSWCIYKTPAQADICEREITEKKAMCATDATQVCY